MNAATVQLILALLPLAEELVFKLGGELVRINTADIKSAEDIVAAIEASKSQGWPRLEFVSPVKEG